MPHCPRCEKRFPTNQKVVRHLGQPRSSCALLIDDLITLSEPLQPSPHSSVRPQQETDIPDMYSADSNDTAAQYYGDIEMASLDPEPNPSSNHDANESEYREEFPGASKVFGSGTTFMDNFDSDGFADLRQENLYYPFASKGDWEMAAFLLRSGLSMAKIDDFLNLQLVGTRTHNTAFYLLILNHRFKICPSHFEQQRS